MRERKLNRLRDYDYAKPGMYFVTVCTQNRLNHFGKIVDIIMYPNELGQIVEDCWLNLPNHYANCHLDQFIVMPNHIHGIIQIITVGNGFKPFPTKHGLSEFIRGLKTYSSRRINDKFPNKNFRWQKSFHDHIIRDDADLYRIRQ